MQAFTRTTGAAVPMLASDINTDDISPIQMARKLQPDYQRMLFMRSRWQPDGEPVADHVLNQPQFSNPAILVTGANFGCGSSREAAVWALMANGITCIVAPSFADQFRENCLQNGLLTITLEEAVFAEFAQRVVAADGAPFTADLDSQSLSGPGGAPIHFDIAPADRLALLEGLDDIGLTSKHQTEIDAWEARTASQAPWYQVAFDNRLDKEIE
ncbi:3-isopropylmalate dehydratase small subunit [Ancylobacter terrae]|uniref:3-isopropylmalate dehydratase small subunit n=1 Tax=Ancylobacter sp. sgz301288 TaxID=3342077 RepID=UPI00385FAFFB